MANSFDDTNPITRDIVIVGYHLRMVLDINGIKFYRKGDRRNKKPFVQLEWSQALQGAVEWSYVHGDFKGKSLDEHLGFKDKK